MSRPDFVRIARRETHQRSLAMIYGTALVALCIGIAVSLWIAIV
jgi:flagellar biosynthesis protein FliQ